MVSLVFAANITIPLNQDINQTISVQDVYRLYCHQAELMKSGIIDNIAVYKTDILTDVA